MTDIIGYVFPIHLQHADSIFEKGKNVFAKFGRELKRLEHGAKALFYISGKKFLIGEATIKSMERMIAEEAWEKYGSKLFLTREELFTYSRTSPIGGKRKTKHMVIYVLTNVKKYEKPLTTKRRMTTAGYYITKDEYLALQEHSN